MNQNVLRAGVLLLASLSNAVGAAVLDLSTDGSNPTPLSFSAGDNVVDVKLDPSAGADSRFFRFDIGAGYRLTSIQLQAFTFSQIGGNPTATGVAFFGLKQGTTITPSVVDPSAVDGYALLGAPVGTTPINGVIPTNVGEDVFPSLIATGAFTGTQLPATLGVGSYTVWLRESRTMDTFSLNFNVAAVPLPGAAWLMGSVLLGLVGWGNRRAPRSNSVAA